MASQLTHIFPYVRTINVCAVWQKEDRLVNVSALYCKRRTDWLLFMTWNCYHKFYTILLKIFKYCNLKKSFLWSKNFFLIQEGLFVVPINILYIYFLKNTNTSITLNRAEKPGSNNSITYSFVILQFQIITRPQTLQQSSFQYDRILRRCMKE